MIQIVKVNDLLHFTMTLLSCWNRAAMMEFEINMSEMPLGKLSKRHIERGLQVSTFRYRLAALAF